LVGAKAKKFSTHTGGALKGGAPGKAQSRPVNFPVENGQSLTRREIPCSERCSGHDQTPDEQKES